MKIYLDDIRYPLQTYPEDNQWLIARNYTEFTLLLEDFIHVIDVISFDHDIDSYDENENELTGYDCLKYLCNYIQDTNMNIDNLELRFHTANPVGKENMICYWNNFKKHYGESL